MMCFTAFQKIRLNPGMRDIALYPLFPVQGTLTSRWVKPTAVRVWVRRNIDILYPVEPPEAPISLMPKFNRVFRKAVGLEL